MIQRCSFFLLCIFLFFDNILQVFKGLSGKLLEGHLLKITIQPSCNSTAAIQECYLVKFSGKITCKTLFNVHNCVSHHFSEIWETNLIPLAVNMEKHRKNWRRKSKVLLKFYEDIFDSTLYFNWKPSGFYLVN